MAGYFAFFLLSLTTYRKLILAEYDIGYFAYGAALVEAMILGKVVLIGEVLHLGRRFDDRPLIVATIWRSLVFAIFAAGLIAAEHVVVALVHGRPVASEFQFSGGHGDEMVARFQLMLVAFVPFFAIRDLARSAGLGELSAVLFRTRKGGGDGA